jgi:hypothetical protein
MATLPNPPSGGRPLRRFAIFATFLLVLVVIAESQPRAAGSQRESMCVCMASKAALMMKSIKTMAVTAHAKSCQPHLTQTASTAK